MQFLQIDIKWNHTTGEEHREYNKQHDRFLKHDTFSGKEISAQRSHHQIQKYADDQDK